MNKTHSSKFLEISTAPNHQLRFHVKNILTLTSVEFNFFINLASCNKKEGITLSKSGRKKSRSNFDPYMVVMRNIKWDQNGESIVFQPAGKAIQKGYIYLLQWGNLRSFWKLDIPEKRRGGPCPLGFEKLLVTLQHPAMLVQGKWESLIWSWS